MQDAQETLADAGEPDRYVFCTRPRCPLEECGSSDLRTIRSRTEDETVTRRTECLTCGHKFFVVWD